VGDVPIPEVLPNGGQRRRGFRIGPEEVLLSRVVLEVDGWWIPFIL